MAEVAPDTSHLSIENSSVFAPESEPAEVETQVAEQEAEPEGDGEGEAEPPEGEAEEASHKEPDDLETLIQQFAKEHELDLTNPKNRAAAKRLADRELTYRKQQEEIAKLKTAKPDYLSTLRRNWTARRRKPPSRKRPKRLPLRRGKPQRSPGNLSATGTSESPSRTTTKPFPP